MVIRVRSKNPTVTGLDRNSHWFFIEIAKLCCRYNSNLGPRMKPMMNVTKENSSFLAKYPMIVKAIIT